MIERVQRKFLKFLSFKADGVYPDGGIDNPILFERFQMNSLECRRNLHCVIFLYNPSLLSRLSFSVSRHGIREQDFSSSPL